jgi:triosephosphate isomerase
MPKFMVANWKENPKSQAAALDLFKGVAKVKRKNVEVVLCPPFIYLESITHSFKTLRSKDDFSIGAQDVFWEEAGPFTGEVGPRMLKSLGVRYVIIGHSERRKWLGETDEMINKKIKLAIADGLQVILCVGEPISVRVDGVAAAKKFIGAQLKKDLKGVGMKSHPASMVIAYEPIWAIGTGKNDSPEDARDIAMFIAATVKKLGSWRSVKVLYGGSVNSSNVGDYVQYKEIDGALVGGASLSVDEFGMMIKKSSGK